MGYSADRRAWHGDGIALTVERGAAPPPEMPTWRVTAWDTETGALLGRCEIAADDWPLAPDAVLDRIGGRFRLEAVRVDLATARLSLLTRRVAHICGRRRSAARRWRRRADGGETTGRVAAAG
ncbi:hypothetical protein RHODGE_RHODGE_03467 [Rhodoplanes serenus]|uniref:Uncharacterized protein n=1 Tax=Rhodoplanes serenus TaxID=200615 RepID=A0A447CYD4_9BRAD|nr:hypothetical protein [Rhodoplanes serenus]VCU10279.1 hypothetical protein RHODGE_RHODGE_03467 [Rhodoplanes serenus]